MKTKVINRRGELIDHDDSSIIPDGCGVRVPIMLQDAAPDPTHATRLTDALGRPAGSRPGYVYTQDTASEAAARAAHDAQVEYLGGAWNSTAITAASPEPPDVTPDNSDAPREAYKAQLSKAWQTTLPSASAAPGNVSFLGSFGGDGT